MTFYKQSDARVKRASNRSRIIVVQVLLEPYRHVVESDAQKTEVAELETIPRLKTSNKASFIRYIVYLQL